MSELTAIDILLNPDETALAHAKAANAKLRENFPDGFELDAQHVPHITTLQRYVRTADLDEVFAAVEQVIRSRDASKLELRAVAYGHLPIAAVPGVGVAAMVIAPTPELLELQAALIDAVAPYTESGGAAAAYVTTPQEPDINQDTLHYIERYVPDHSGSNYIGHVTVGIAKLDFLTALEAEPFDEFAFHPAGCAVFKLGNNGTARHELKAWEL